MHVVFVEPSFPTNQREFVRGLHGVGALVSGIGERPKEALDNELKHWLGHYEQVSSVCHEETMVQVIRWLHERVPVDRLEATVEAHILPAAHVRETCGIRGTTAKTAYLCRDKPAMKQVLREGGIPCAESIGSGSSGEIREFARRVGYPFIVKPRAAAGAAGTVRVDSDGDLSAALERFGVDRGGSVAVEEFIEGHEAFYDTLTIGGEVVHDFVSHYYPGVLEAMRTRWISPQFLATNRVDSAGDYDEVRRMGKKVIDLLEIETSATHMEWFFGPKGLKFSEIGCRPPGVGAWDLYCAANEFDLYSEWASAVVHGHPIRPPSRRYSAGLIALRPEKDGHIAGYEGLDEIWRRFGEWILDAHLPPDGTPTQPVDAGYMANAWIRMRHPDYDELRRMLDRIGETVQVRAR
jgi:phosphoribosylaminoimidazole carboxylase (NCAIR synthetase)